VVRPAAEGSRERLRESVADRPARITVLVGNPKPNSRTLRVAVAAADALTRPDDRSERTTIDLAEIAGELFDPESLAVAAFLEKVASSDVVIVASPTYKATYSGLLKSFVDRYGNNSLATTVAVPVMTGATPAHALAAEVFLRPLLVELGASVPCRGLFVAEGDFGNLEAVVADWARWAVPQIDRVARGGLRT
jgi:FMN reductase